MQHDSSKLQLYLALNRLCGLIPRDVEYLSQYDGDLATFLSSSSSSLKRAGFSEKSIRQLKLLDWKLVEEELRWAENPNHHIITLADNNYPNLLRSISAPPIVLFVYGQLDCLQRPQLAMVGSRNPTPTGRDIALQFAHYLTENGLVITSGLAVGIDSASHEGALQCGSTIAVMGTGIDQIYPARNQILVEKIIERGAVISEFPLHTPIKKSNFPRRNRVISGLSIGTLVVEAALRSGSLITAKFAGEQGREVFAIPGSIHNPLSRGCHKLIRDGAKLVEKGQDILEELRNDISPARSKFAHGDPGGESRFSPWEPPSGKDFACSHASEHAKNGIDANISSKVKQEILDEDRAKLLSSIGFEATAIDMLVARSGLAPEAVASTLLILELDGRVKKVSGGYIKCYE
jgi:DNA processing protein